MAIFLYLARGISLLGCLVWPPHRRRTVARWKTSRPHKNVFEIGTGLIGLILIGALLVLIMQRVEYAWSQVRP